MTRENVDDDARRARRARVIALAWVIGASFASAYAADPVLRRNTNAAINRGCQRLRRQLHRPERIPTPPEISALHAEARAITREAARYATD